jgi:tetratricopeptide (TPR) repeat protein|tara:strand:+ start:36 stop:542 length:507 start_codon:yes stop_codon:yes gene_type:complete
MTDEPTHDEAEAHLDGLGEQFLTGIECIQKGDMDAAAEHFQRILRVEPRLAEPRIELARILLETKQPKEAEAEVREAIRILEAKGVWLDTLPENQVSSIAFGLLGEALRTLAESDGVVFGPPDAWRAIVEEAHAAFKKARELDPDNSHANYWASGFDVDAGAEDVPSD